MRIAGRAASAALAALAFAAATLVVLVLRLDAADMARPIALSRPTLVTIPARVDLAHIARILAESGVVTDEWLLRMHVRLAGISATLQAGTYEIAPGDTPRAVLERIAAGRTKTFTLTIIEGARFRDLRELLRAQPYVEHTLGTKNDEEVTRAVGLEGRPPEGLFMPSTYHYKAGTPDVALLARAHRHLQRTLDDAWQHRAADLPYGSPYDALIMASIIEKETARSDERRQIAGVFVRRLLKGMKLQTDPTVIYGLGDAYAGNLRRTDLQHDSAYNTYTRNGLPPTPIAMPGAAALTAALDPAPGAALYFVARGDGSHVFSETLEAHNAAVRTYQYSQRGDR